MLDRYTRWLKSKGYPVPEGRGGVFEWVVDHARRVKHEVDAWPPWDGLEVQYPEGS